MACSIGTRLALEAPSFLSSSKQPVCLLSTKTRVCRNKPSTSSSSHHGRQRLVILGTGWGSYSVFKNVNKKLFDVIVISPRNHFLFTPLLASTTVGTLEFRSIIEPVRNSGFRDEHHYHLSYAQRLDTENRLVYCESALDATRRYSVEYDHLVIGVGAVSNDFGVPGVKEHAFFLKEIVDARRIRNRILTNFELATQLSESDPDRRSLLHVVIVGGGPTGVEFGAEFYDFFQQDLGRLFPEEKLDVQITLVEANQILSSFDKKLRNYTEKLMKKRKSMNIVQASVVEVTATEVRLNNGRIIPCGLVVWSTGVAPRRFTKDLQLDKTKRGQIKVDDHLRACGDETGRVYSLGDCASVEGQELPCTAQAAERQGRYLAKALGELVGGGQPEAFLFKPWGMLAYVGGYKALVDKSGITSQGFSSWVLWRSAYTTQLGSWRLRMQVPIDWCKTFFFGRDTSRF